MSTSVVRFYEAWGEYSRSQPPAMEHPVVPVTRPDTEGITTKVFRRRGEPFTVLCVIFASSLGGLIRRVAAWQARQAHYGPLHLPQGSIPNCQLLRVRRAEPYQQMVAASNNATHRQTLALTFLQLSETDG
ncbi:MAG: hypothetical protein PVH68_04785 [Armatimonadota bacterium]|jgi:hypothetical protein